MSGRALRAEERLHLFDTKARQAKMATKAPAKGARGSRRWRKLRARQRAQEARHKRRIRQAHHEAAKKAVAFAAGHRIGTLVVGDPKGIAKAKGAGPKHNLRLHQWRRTHLSKVLCDKAERAGITIRLVDERGTSSTCPQCRNRVAKTPGSQLCLSHLWVLRAPRCRRRPQHRRYRRRNYEQDPARHAPSSGASPRTA